VKTQLVKIALVVSGLALAIFLSCTDNQPPEFPSLDEVQDARQKNSSSSEQSGMSSSSGVVSSSSSEDVSCDDVDKCNGKCYDKETEFCYNKTDVVSKCGGNSYNVPIQICCDNALYPKSSYGCCAGTEYLLLGYGCKDNVVLTKCGENLYNPKEQFCASNGSVNFLCGGKQFDPPKEYCDIVDGKEVIKGECGNKTLDYNVQFCYDETPYNLCGGKNYNPPTQFCSSANEVKDLCGGEVYNPAAQFCYDNDIKNKCGGEEYNPESQFCQSGTNEVKPLCGTQTYTSTEFCQSANVVKPLCGTLTYTSTEFCQSTNVVKPLCGTLTYTSAQFCQSANVVKDLCGGLTYTAGQFCHTDNTIKDKCGGTVVWNPTTEKCCGSNKYTLATQGCCKNNTYDLQKLHYGNMKKQFCDERDGKAYMEVDISSQTWMAENLNYDASNSRCNNNLETNCTTYGRLYNWTTAMGGSASSTANPSGVQGVCPSGWHLPSKAEWEILIALTGYNGAAQLRPTSGWSSGNAGTDNYKFSALPGGFGDGNTWFQPAGQNIGTWWFSTENNSSSAYRLYLDSSSPAAVIDNTFQKQGLCSVRCVRN